MGSGFGKPPAAGRLDRPQQKETIMRSADMRRLRGAPQSPKPAAAKLIGAVKPSSVFILLAICVAPASAASLSRSAEVNGTPHEIWSMIGPFCAIKDWHPAIATCAEDG